MRCWCGNPAEGDVCLDSEWHDPNATGVVEDPSRLYVAGPMTGFPQNNYPTFHRVARELRSVGYDVVSPAEFGVPVGRVHYVDLLRDDLRKLLDCHGVATLGDWWGSTGARNEVMVAGTLKMPVLPWAEWVDLKQESSGLNRSFERRAR